jgi:hypothetical protein
LRVQRNIGHANRVYESQSSWATTPSIMASGSW